MDSIEERAEKLSRQCAPFKRDIERLHYKDGVVVGYTACNEDVVKMINAEIAKYRNKPVTYRILTDLLTTLKKQTDGTK